MASQNGTTGSIRGFVGYAADRQRPVAQSYTRKEPVMTKHIRFVGLDVHADTIVGAVAEMGREGAVVTLGRFANRPEAVRKMMKRLGDPKKLRVVYEAGPCGFELYWLLTGMGIECMVAAPTLIAKKSG